MLITYRRHNPAKCRFRSRSEYRCKCPIWVSGTKADGERVREALKIHDWNRAQEEVRRWDVKGSGPIRVERVTVDERQKKFIQEAEAANLSGETLLDLTTSMTSVRPGMTAHFLPPRSLSGSAVFSSSHWSENGSAKIQPPI